MKPYAAIKNEDYEEYKKHENVYDINFQKVIVNIYAFYVCIYTFDCNLENILKYI